MCYPRMLQQMTRAILIMVVLVGCDSPFLNPVQPTQQTSICPTSDISSQGVLRSTDHGVTWDSLGKACIQGLNGLMPVDPTPLVVDGHIVLYFVDLGHLNKPIPQHVYRVTSTDGVNFDTPQPSYTQSQTIVDPFVLGLPDGSFRLYIQSEKMGITSAISKDSITFKTQGTGNLGNLFGMPGLLLLPDNRIRFYGSDHPESQGLGSLISNDGLNFTRERGLRISLPPDYLYVNNPEPIRLADGSYLMLYQTQDKKHRGRPEWMAEIRLATSTDGFNWVANPTIIGYGGTSCVAEAPDGTLFIYYGTQ